MKKRPLQVTVIGASDDRENSVAAERIGRFIGSHGYTLITGGRGGIMEAVSRGAAESGGTVVGILPGIDDSDANASNTIVLPTGIGFARNSMNILAGDIIIAMGGKSGTLSELAYAWQYGKPVIACTFTGGWSSKIVNEPLDDRKGTSLMPASTPEEVCAILKEWAEKRFPVNN